MSLKPMAIPPVPAETARVARAAFPKGNLYMKLLYEATRAPGDPHPR